MGPCSTIYTLGAGGSPGTPAPWVFIYMKLLHGWCYASSGVGWGGDDNVPCTCTHGRCYATSCFLHLHTWLVLRNIMFFALAHMVGATQHHVSCTCTHGRCYATSWGGVGVGWGGDDTILCRKWLLQKLTFHHNEMTVFEHSQYPTQRTFGEPPAPSVYIYIYTYNSYITHDSYMSHR